MVDVADYNNLFIKAKNSLIEKDLFDSTAYSYYAYLYNNCKELYRELSQNENIVVAEKCLKYLISKDIIIDININTLDTNNLYKGRILLPNRFIQHNFLTLQAAIFSEIGEKTTLVNFWNTLTIIYQQMMSSKKNYGAHISWKEDKEELLKSLLTSFLMSLGLHNVDIFIPDKNFFMKYKTTLLGTTPTLENYYKVLKIITDE